MEQQSQLSTDPTKVKCPHCGSSNCFEESSPVKSGDYVNYISDTVESYMCVSCGYTTTTLNVEGSDMVKQYEESTADLIKSLRFVDTTNLVWYPIVLNFPSTGIIFPDGTSKSNWGWRAAPAVDIPVKEQKKYPLPGKKKEYYTRRIDMDAGKLFAGKDFYNACKFIGFIKD